jgi:acetolactate synthase-1/2/3 large subunit
VLKTPNGVDAAAAAFAGCDLLLLVGARAPVGFFAYPGKPGSGVPDACAIDVLARPDEDVIGALQAVGDRIGIRAGAMPMRMTHRSAAELAGSPGGAFSADVVIRAVAAALPEGAIVCDETISSGFRLFELTDGTPPHDYLPLTGGAIGIGPPLATGAAIACQDRKVVCLQADGSAMYTVQALWTQARERLDVVTVIFANRSYALLHRELQAVGAGAPGRSAERMLKLVEPTIDWVKLAESMGVEAFRVETAAALARALQSALAQPSERGPRLIEAVIR